jgi:uncharacterized protein
MASHPFAVRSQRTKLGRFTMRSIRPSRSSSLSLFESILGVIPGAEWRISLNLCSPCMPMALMMRSDHFLLTTPWAASTVQPASSNFIFTGATGGATLTIRLGRRFLLRYPKYSQSVDGTVTHFEIPADDVERARTFYAGLFEWELSPFYGSDYLYITPKKTAAKVPRDALVTGGLDKRSKELEHVTVVFGVESVERSLRIVEKLGGKVFRKKQPVGDFGFSAYFRDTEGNVLGLFEQMKPSPKR